MPTTLENDLILSLTKMRAHTYNIDVIEKDLALLHRARKKPFCHLATAHLITGIVLFFFVSVLVFFLFNSSG